jgi:hypothetical protein
VLHGFSFANYLEELGPTAQQAIYKKSSIDLALRDALRKMRNFLMTYAQLSRWICPLNFSKFAAVVAVEDRAGEPGSAGGEP